VTGWQQVALVARRDFLQRATSRPFLLTMVFIVGIVIVGGPFLADATTPDPTRDVGVVAPLDENLERLLTSAADQVDLEASVVEVQDREAGDRALTGGEIDVLVVAQPAPGTLVWMSSPDPRLATAVTQALRASAQAEQVDELGLSRPDAAALLSPPAPGEELLDPVDPQEGADRAASFVGMLLLYFAVVLFGQFVMLGVVEEKSSRVVEVVLSRVVPYRLLAGKVIGVGALGVVQILALAVAIYVAARLSGAADDLSLDAGLIGSIVGWFLVGFAFFAVLYAALGATVTRQEDVQSVALLPLVIVLPAYFIAIFGADDPDSLLVRVTSILPPLSPFIMPIRAASTDVPAWQIALSVALLLAATYAVIRLAGRIYSGAILSVGRRVSLRDAWRGSVHVPTE
jgi:ABC-2 type transport system permease protein